SPHLARASRRAGRQSCGGVAAPSGGPLSKAAMKTSWSRDIVEEKRQQYQGISLKISSCEKEPFRCSRRLPGRRGGRRDPESRVSLRQRLTPAVDDCGEGPRGHDGSAVQQGLDFLEEADWLSL